MILAKTLPSFEAVNIYRSTLHVHNMRMTEYSKPINPKSKIRSLMWNFSGFSGHDRLLFIKPLISAFLGVIVYSFAYKLKKPAS
jgi:hypothetical protein